MIIVEDGSIVEGAQSYASVEDADAYFEVFPEWTDLEDAVKEQALVKATRTIDAVEFPGTRVDADQPLQWPRSGCYYGDGSLAVSIGEDEIPLALVNAVYEMAYAIACSAWEEMVDSGIRSVGTPELNVSMIASAATLPRKVNAWLSKLTFESNISKRLYRV